MPSEPIRPFAKFRAIRTQRVYEQIAEEIEDVIRTQGLKAGDRLPAERELADQFGVSRPSIREAMIALETAGLIEVRTGDGTYVKQVVPRGLPVLAWRPSDPGPGVLEQFQARKLIEPELAALAATRIDRDDIAYLQELMEFAASCFAKSEPADGADYKFHTRLAEASGNLILAGVVRHLWDLRDGDMWRVIRARVVRNEHRLMVLDDRRRIIKACVDRDPDGARASMNNLLARAEERYFG